MLFSVFMLASLDCFSRESSVYMDLRSGFFYLKLIPSLAEHCYFPPGVFIYFTFKDPALDFFQVATDFSYEQNYTLKVPIDVALKAYYELVMNIMVNVSSFGIESIFSIGKVENMRVWQDSPEDANSFEISESGFCFNFTRPYKDASTSKTLKLTLKSGEQAQLPVTALDASSACGTENAQGYLYAGITRAELAILGASGGITTADYYYSTRIRFKRDTQLYKDTSVLRYYQTHFVMLLHYDEADMVQFEENFLKLKERPLQFCLNFVFSGATHSAVCGTLNEYFLRNPGRFRASDFDDYAQYNETLRQIGDLSLSSISASLKIYITINGKVQAMQNKFGTFGAVCFTTGTIRATPKQMEVMLPRNPHVPTCPLDTPADTQIIIGEYMTAEDEMKVQAGLTTHYTTVLEDFAQSDSSFSIPLSKSEFMRVRDAVTDVTRVVIYFLRNGDWVNDASIAYTRFTDTSGESIVIAVCVIVGCLVICVVSILESVIRRKCSRTGKGSTKLTKNSAGRLDDL